MFKTRMFIWSTRTKTSNLNAIQCLLYITIDFYAILHLQEWEFKSKTLITIDLVS